ncbi:HAMP domain-containing protein [Rhodovarius crocodyli]|uniref:histidine kinase n=1 Tax=Rhodovarius crocodyli TaxID=1979269 RepID=A0A437LXB2_9PROT|nr:ATP-binding protein [Rhodovarius crocodyli]RVT90020.1 HAMP domain-containing protein [Rhodovarius crocodyli]
MTRQLTLLMRLALIVAMALSVVWILMIGAYFRQDFAQRMALRPAPERIAALAGLLEGLPAEGRAALLLAVGTEEFQVHLVPAGEAVPPRYDAALLAGYAAAMPGRALSLAQPPLPDRWFPRLSNLPRNAMQLRVGLAGGQVLVVDTRAPVPVTALGVPVGFGAGLFGTLVALVALLIMQRETRPLARLAAAADRMDLAGPPVPLPEVRRSAPEIRAVVGAFARMQERLSGLLQARMALLGGIAHDVRSFATRLRLRIDALPDAAERERAETDIADMIRLLDDALLSSRAGAGELAQEMVELPALLRAEVDDRLAQGARATLALDVPEWLVVLGDPLALRRVVANLVGNALAYGHAAHLGLRTEGEEAVLTVDDEGPGIPPDQRLAMLEPFTRLDASRNRRTGGAGLGLAIARGLLEAHGGRLAILDAPDGGARMEVRLPVFR